MEKLIIYLFVATVTILNVVEAKALGLQSMPCDHCDIVYRACLNEIEDPRLLMETKFKCLLQYAQCNQVHCKGEPNYQVKKEKLNVLQRQALKWERQQSQKMLKYLQRKLS